MEELARQIEDEEINLPEKPRNYLKRVFQETIYRPLVEKSILLRLVLQSFSPKENGWQGAHPGAWLPTPPTPLSVVPW